MRVITILSIVGDGFGRISLWYFRDIIRFGIYCVVLLLSLFDDYDYDYDISWLLDWYLMSSHICFISDRIYMCWGFLEWVLFGRPYQGPHLPIFSLHIFHRTHTVASTLEIRTLYKIGLERHCIDSYEMAMILDELMRPCLSSAFRPPLCW